MTTMTTTQHTAAQIRPRRAEGGVCAPSARASVDGGTFRIGCIGLAPEMRSTPCASCSRCGAAPGERVMRSGVRHTYASHVRVEFCARGREKRLSPTKWRLSVDRAGILRPPASSPHHSELRVSKGPRWGHTEACRAGKWRGFTRSDHSAPQWPGDASEASGCGSLGPRNLTVPVLALRAELLRPHQFASNYGNTKLQVEQLVGPPARDARVHLFSPLSTSERISASSAHPTSTYVRV